jgi:hypothetical protein
MVLQLAALQMELQMLPRVGSSSSTGGCLDGSGRWCLAIGSE